MKILIDARESGTSTGRYVDKLVEYLHKACLPVGRLKPEYEIIILAKSHRLSFFKEIAPSFKAVKSDFKEFTFAEQRGQSNEDHPSEKQTRQQSLRPGQSFPALTDSFTGFIERQARFDVNRVDASNQFRLGQSVCGRQRAGEHLHRFAAKSSLVRLRPLFQGRVQRHRNFANHQ